MRYPIIQPYYCIIKKKKFGEYLLQIRENTSTAKARKELKHEGYRVLLCVSSIGLVKLQESQTFEDFLRERPSSNWTQEAFDFMKEIRVKTIDDLTGSRFYHLISDSKYGRSDDK